MQNQQYNSIKVILLLVVIASLGYFVISNIANRSDLNSGKVINSGVDQNNLGSNYKPKPQNYASSYCGLNITAPSPNSGVSGGTIIGPVTITGFIANLPAEQCKWTMFEGTAGTLQFQFKDNTGWHNLGDYQVIHVDNWMSLSTPFVPVTFSFNNDGIGLSSGTLLQIVFTEENPSGQPNPDTFTLPLVLE